MRPSVQPLLEIASLAKRYGDAVVFANVHLSVRAGEFVAILGESVRPPRTLAATLPV